MVDQRERNRLQAQNIEAAIAADNPGFELALCELRRLLGALVTRHLQDAEGERLLQILHAELKRGGLLT